MSFAFYPQKLSEKVSAGYNILICKLATFIVAFTASMLNGLQENDPPMDRFLGAHGAGETPVPIPNTAVKPSSGYNTWVLALGK